jgi:hypothetical protein
MLWGLYADEVTIEEIVEQMTPLLAPDVTDVARFPWWPSS